MGEVEKPGKVSLFDLLTAMCFFGPIGTGWTVGSKVGFAGIATGLILGLFFGLLSAFLFLRALRLIGEHWFQHETTGTMREKACAMIAFVGSIAWVLGTTALSALLAEYVIKLVAD
jgi:hypothetical protein